MQVLRLCQEAGLVKLGHVALDGTKIKANASKHKAMSYGRMCAAERQLEQEVAALLAQAQQVDADEEAQYGAGRRGDELPAELARRESPLAKIRAAKAALEQEAQARAAGHAEAARAKRAERAAQEAATGKQAAGRAPTVPDPAQARPEPTAQRNFIDPDSRIMKDGATKSFAQAYNAQAAVDEHVQIVVATAVIQEANDKQQLVPMIEQVAANCGAWPAQVSADAGYFSEANVTAPQLAASSCMCRPTGNRMGPPPRGRASRWRPTRRSSRRCGTSSRRPRATTSTPAARRWWSRCSGRARRCAASAAFRSAACTRSGRSGTSSA